MFVLRVIKEERNSEKSPFKSRTMNFQLGDYYEVSREKTDRFGESTFGIVLGEKCREFPLNKDSLNIHFTYFIMNGVGGSFEKIVDKK